MTRSRLSVFLIVGVVSGCGGPKGPSDSLPRGESPRFPGMGGHHRRITTRSSEAQAFFDQGLVWAFAFNHDEAIRSFETAARRDPDAAMPWWGAALCHGPHINYPMMPAERSKAAWEALQKARARMGTASPVERDLIEALSARYADPPPADRRPLDEAYASAMEACWRKHADDADVATLFAESLMDLQPWDLWTHGGQPKGRTKEIIAVLEAALRIDPDHPGALHLYIHAVEASPNPGRALAAADRLRRLVPDAGHLVHMPSHIDVRVGHYAAASDQNEMAIDADRRYRQRVPRQGFYRVYMLHNHHFLAFSCMMEGRMAAALKAAREMVAGVPEEYARRESALVDPYMMIVFDVLKRFGRWDDLLREPRPPAHLPITTAHWRFARGVALAAKGDVAGARREQAAFRQAVAAVPKDAMMAINKAHHVLEIASHMLEGEIALRERRTDAAVAALREAVRLEDNLIYMEPPEWTQPVRHTLAAVLLDAGRVREAEQVYRDDLADWPENGWSLHGLAQCLRERGESAEFAAVKKRFTEAWRRADVEIGSSCLCVPGRVLSNARHSAGWPSVGLAG